MIGPLPPPVHGHMVFTEQVLRSQRLAREFRVVHVDTSDHRGLGNIGRFDPLNVLLAIRHVCRLVSVLVRSRPSIVYVPLAQNTLGLGRDLIFIALGLIGRARVVAHVHGGEFGSFVCGAPAWFRVPARALLRRTAMLVVMTDWQRDRVKACLPEARVAVVPHGTASLEAPPRVARDGQLRALFVSSSLHEAKGIRTLLAAAAHSQASGITTEWEVVGPWLNEAERLAAEAIADGVPGIHFRGALAREDLTKAYERADVFVFPTHAMEGFGLVRIEAMAAGLPVITTEAGGAREIIRDGVDGFIVDYDAPEAIVDRLVALQRDPAHRITMGAQAQTRQRSLFSDGAFDEALTGVLRSVSRSVA